MAAEVVLTADEARAFSSLLSRASEKLVGYEERTHPDRTFAEELEAAADDLARRLAQTGQSG